MKKSKSQGSSEEVDANDASSCPAEVPWAGSLKMKLDSLQAAQQKYKDQKAGIKKVPPKASAWKAKAQARLGKSTTSKGVAKPSGSQAAQSPMEVEGSESASREDGAQEVAPKRFPSASRIGPASRRLLAKGKEPLGDSATEEPASAAQEKRKSVEGNGHGAAAAARAESASEDLPDAQPLPGAEQPGKAPKAPTKSRPSLGAVKAKQASEAAQAPQAAPKQSAPKPKGRPKGRPPGSGNLKRLAGMDGLEEEEAAPKARRASKPGADESSVAEDGAADVDMAPPDGTVGASPASNQASESGRGGKEASSGMDAKAASDGPKAKASQKAVVEAGSKGAKADPRHLGASPTIMLAQGLPLPPRALLPEDAALTRVKPKKAMQLKATLHPDTLKEAEEAGFAARALWPGLGEIPEILRGGFRSLLILGPSGSGKSTLLRALLKELFPTFDGPLYPSGEWCRGRAVIEAFDTAFQGRDLLGSVGLSSVPSWCKPFEVLSVGEKYRANIALALQKRSKEPGLPLIFDEWTSELDRCLARVVSVALGKRLHSEAESPPAEEKKVDKDAPQSAGGAEGAASQAAEDSEPFPRGPVPEAAGATEGDEEEDFPRSVPGLVDSLGENEDELEDAEYDACCNHSTDDRMSGSGAEEEGEEAEEAEEEAVEEHGAEEEDGGHGVGEGGEPVECEKPVARGSPTIGRRRSSRTGSLDGQQGEDASASVMEDADVVTDGRRSELKVALGAEGGEEAAKDGEKSKRPGPFIFASCHEDVAAYLQPEFVCFCAVGEAPRAFRNTRAGTRLTLHSELQGDLIPFPVHTGIHLLVGHWQSNAKDLAPFMIGYKKVAVPGNLRLAFEGGRKVESLRRSDSPCVRGSLSPWYAGISQPDGGELRLRLLNERTLVIQQREKDNPEWSKDMRATRRRLPQPLQALMLTRDPETVANASAVVNYGDFDADTLKAHGWYLPPELAPDGKYAGLERSREPLLVSSSDFKFEYKFERIDDHQQFLATYVGEPEGGLSAKLTGVSKLLDCPFDGLCIHKVPKLPPLGDFSIGVITGPSGSGKGTLARHLFGPSPSVLWTQDAPVISHFNSLVAAREFCGAVGLDLNVAMQPYAAMSSGEQSRADLARILSKVAGIADGSQSAGREDTAFVLDEFTSLVDRPLARRMARGVQRLAQRRNLRKLVIVSCHDDFVGSGLLEPDWLFECRNGRLLHFRTRQDRMTENVRVLAGQKLMGQELTSAQASLEEAENELGLLQKRLSDCEAATCFSETFKTELGVMKKVLVGLCEKELERVKSERSAAHAGASQTHEVAKQGVQMSQGDSEAPDPEGSESEVEVPPEERLQRALEPPVLELEVRRALPREWVHFREHHYKDKSLHTATISYVGLIDGRAACFLAICGEKVNFVQKNALRADWSVTGYPKPWAKGNTRRLFREHRTVVLPDFQGMGLAPLICDSVASHVLELGHDFTSQTVHPFYGGYRDRSPFWGALPSNRKGYSALNGNYKFSHVFVGAVRPNGQTDPRLAEELKRRIGRRPSAFCH